MISAPLVLCSIRAWSALPVYIARRRMMRMEPPVIYVPDYAIEDIRRLLLVMQRLDRGSG